MPAKQKQTRKKRTTKPLRLIDERLVTALAHEVRAHAMGIFAVRPASAKEVANELGLTVSAVWYHVNKLRELGCIELVETKQRRGATEHFYRATVRHFLGEEEWPQIPSQKRVAITTGILRLISADFDMAVRAGAVDAADSHLSRTLLTVDRKGRKESSALLESTVENLLAILERATMRMAKSDEKPIRSSVAIMQFDLQPRVAG